MHAQFDVELWVDTTGTVPQTKVFKTVSATDPFAAMQEARKRAQEENPDINVAKIDGWSAEISLE